jgi:hypothetical protein
MGTMESLSIPVINRNHDRRTAGNQPKRPLQRFFEKNVSNSVLRMASEPAEGWASPCNNIHPQKKPEKGENCGEMAVPNGLHPDNFIQWIDGFITNMLNLSGIKPEKAHAGCELNTACPGRMDDRPQTLLSRRKRSSRSSHNV